MNKPQTLMERVAFLEQRVKMLEDCMMAYHGVKSLIYVPEMVTQWWKDMKPITEEMAKKGVIE